MAPAKDRGSANLGEIDTLLSQGQDMEYIASHYNMDLPLIWALRLEGKTDQEKFKELGWGLRTWDQWNLNECDEPFGDDWPITRKTDLIFFDPPHYIKQEKAYREKANEKPHFISSYTKQEYEMFLKGFFLLAHQNAKPTTRLAFLNVDWRDFESTPPLKENPDNSITIFDYHRILAETAWKVTHRIECPLSSERLSGNEVQKMQDKRILGTVGRTLLIAKRS